jgi:hypothetical protein
MIRDNGLSSYAFSACYLTFRVIILLYLYTELKKYNLNLLGIE